MSNEKKAPERRTNSLDSLAMSNQELIQALEDKRRQAAAAAAAAAQQDKSKDSKNG